MPKELENKLKKEASNKGLSGDKSDAYVYGTMRKTGWKPKREQQASKHGSLEDIAFHEEATDPAGDSICPVFTHPLHKGSGKGFAAKGEDTGLESDGAIMWGALDPPAIDGDTEQFTKGQQSCNRDAGQGIHYGAPIDYFGPDTDYRAEEIDVHQYGRAYDPYPFRDYYKTDDKMNERTFRVMEQDKYDETPTPGVVTDSQPQTEAYGAVNFRGAGPESADGSKDGADRYRSFEEQRRFARTNKNKSQEYAVDVSGLDTKLGKDIR